MVIVPMAICVHLIAGQSAVKPFTDGDWPRFAGDFAGTKYSKLTQINAKNVSSLAPAWTFAGVGTQQTPIVIAGVMYATTPSGAVALDADTGTLIWRFGAASPPGGGRGRGRGAAGPGGPGGQAAPANGDAPQDGEPVPPPVGAGAAPQATAQAARGAGAAGAPGGGGARGGAVPTAAGPGGAPSSRGLAYWPGDGTIAPRILMTVGQRLVALKATSGELDTTFGTGGFIDMGVPWGGVTLVYKHIVIVGSNNC